MSTPTFQQLLGKTFPARIPPAIAKISQRDFKVCESCGGPAMQHPRFELAQNIAGGREILCCECLHAATQSTERKAAKRDHRFRIGDQIWRCGACKTDRAWGLLEPWDSLVVPALECTHCQGVTRHVYSRVA